MATNFKSQQSKARAEREHELWKTWMNNEKHPDFFQPLRKQYEPLIKQTVTNLSRNKSVPKSTIEHEVNKLFLHGCETYDPKFGTALNTHIHTTIQKAQRFVNDYTGSGHIPEPRQRMIAQFKATQEQLHDQLGTSPNLTQIMNHMNSTYKELGKNIQVTLPDLERLQKEHARKDLTESMTYGDDETEFLQTPKETEAIIMMHYSKPVINGSRNTHRLTEDEHTVFKLTYPMEEGTLALHKQMKPSDIAKHLNWSAPKVSRSIKGINEKIQKAVGLLE